MGKSILFVVLLVFTTLAYSEGVVDVTKISGKSKSEVSGVLGKEISCKDSKYGIKCLYDKGETEIVFINGKADWITIEGIDNVPFDESAIEKIGIKAVTPSFKSSFEIRWETTPKIRSVSIFKGGNNSDYAYIKVSTK